MLRSENGYSLRSYMLAWIILPLLPIVAASAFFLYRDALNSANAAYDRTLLATAHTVGDTVRYERGEFRVSLPRALFEIYETDRSGRYFFRIDTAAGQLIAGDEDLSPFRGSVPKGAIYPEIVRFYDDVFMERPIRVAVLYQPVFSHDDSGTVVIQVAEPMRIRQEAAAAILRDTLFRQGVFLLIAALAVYVSVTRALRPFVQLSAELERRPAADALPVLLPHSRVAELNSVIVALNGLMGRVGQLLAQQKRFIANAAHQLRTPLTVLKTQLQSGLRGDAPGEAIMYEMSDTVERTIRLANQMLLLARIEQRRSGQPVGSCRLDEVARAAALELSPLIGAKNLDFEIVDYAAPIRGDDWLVGELVRNLLANAIRHTPQDGRLGIVIAAADAAGTSYRLRVWDTGGGIRHTSLERVFEPFSSSFSATGSGLGLAICKEIADLFGAEISVHNRDENGVPIGLEVCAVFSAAPTAGLPPVTTV